MKTLRMLKRVHSSQLSSGSYKRFGCSWLEINFKSDSLDFLNSPRKHGRLARVIAVFTSRVTYVKTILAFFTHCVYCISHPRAT